MGPLVVRGWEWHWGGANGVPVCGWRYGIEGGDSAHGCVRIWSSGGSKVGSGSKCVGGRSASSLLLVRYNSCRCCCCSGNWSCCNCCVDCGWEQLVDIAVQPACSSGWSGRAATLAWTPASEAGPDICSSSIISTESWLACTFTDIATLTRLGAEGRVWRAECWPCSCCCTDAVLEFHKAGSDRACCCSSWC